MRIGFFSDFYLPRIDGIAFSIESFRIELEKMGHEVYIIAPRPSFRYKETSKHVVRFPAIKGLFFDDYLTSLFFPPQAMRQLQKLKLDVIHYHTPGQIGLLGAYFALRNDIPLVTTYHTDLYEYVRHYPAVLPGTIALSLLTPMITGGGMSDYRTGLSSIKPERNVDKWNQKIVERSVTMIHNHCDLVITPSDKMMRQLKGWKTKTRLATLPTGVEEITTNEKETEAMRKHLGLPVGAPMILFVGRIGTEKNLGLLLEAYELVLKRQPETYLVIVGAGEDEGKFKAQAARSERPEQIVFTGAVPHQRLGAIYRLATVFAFPSLADTQGLALNEAACAGLPIVMIDATITEVVHHNQNGFIARRNPRDFAAKLIAILSDSKRRQAMGNRSKELAIGYSPSTQAAKLLRLYQEVISHHYETSAKNGRPERRRNP